MASYKTVLKPSVEKDLRFLPRSIVKRALAEVEALQDDPLPRQASKLQGGENLYRIRVGDYRIIYGVDHSMKQILVHYIRHRREAYRKKH